MTWACTRQPNGSFLLRYTSGNADFSMILSLLDLQHLELTLREAGF